MERFSELRACTKCGYSGPDNVLGWHQGEAEEMLAYERYKESTQAKIIEQVTGEPPKQGDRRCPSEEHIHVSCKRCDFVRYEVPLDVPVGAAAGEYAMGGGRAG